jgi:hypothetical protein
MSDLVLPDESYAIMGACFEVFKEMGCGFLEAVYQECLEYESQTETSLSSPNHRSNCNSRIGSSKPFINLTSSASTVS